MNNEVNKLKIQNASGVISAAYDYALKAIIEIVKDNGGLIKTPAASDKPTMYAYYEDFDGTGYHQAIHGLRWDEENGLTLCTDAMLENYQFDNDYCFEYYYDFEGEDLDNLNKALDNPSYFVAIGDYNCVKEDTIKSIIFGLDWYLN